MLTSRKRIQPEVSALGVVERCMTDFMCILPL